MASGASVIGSALLTEPSEGLFFFIFFRFNVYVYIYIVCHRTYLDYIIELEEFLFNKKMFYLYSLYCATETLQWFISNFSFRMNLEIFNYLTLFVFSKGLS